MQCNRHVIVLIFGIDLTFLYDEFQDDVIGVWKKLEVQFPTIAQIARDILCIPAASVGVERTFSIARHLLRFNRNYGPDTFSNILMVRHRLNNKMKEVLKAEAFLEANEICVEQVIEEYNQTMIEAEEIMALDNISDTDELDLPGSNQPQPSSRNTRTSTNVEPESSDSKGDNSSEGADSDEEDEEEEDEDSNKDEAVGAGSTQPNGPNQRQRSTRNNQGQKSTRGKSSSRGKKRR